MYTDRDFKNGKELKLAVVAFLLGLASEKNAREITYYQPNSDLTGATAPRDGKFTVEGPKFPKPHSFYVGCVARNNLIVWCSGLPVTLNPDSRSYDLSKGIPELRRKFPEIAEKYPPQYDSEFEAGYLSRLSKV